MLPIFHDDQHGTAIVTLASYINACRLAQKDPKKSRVVINGAGAAGLTIAKLLHSHEAQNIVVCDSVGAVYKGRQKNMNASKDALAEFTNRNNLTGNLEDVIKGADIFIGVSVKGAFKSQWVKSMN